LYEDAPLMSAGQDVRIRVTLGGIGTAAAVDALDALVTPFVMLASSGALSGDRIDPATSAINDKEGPFGDAKVVEWLLRSCRVDERSITVLAQMFLSVQDICPITRLTISGAHTPGATQLAVSNSPSANPYPETVADPGFPVEREPELYPEFVVRADFAEQISAEVVTDVDAEVFSWAAGLLSGAYGVAPIRPDECTATIDEESVQIKSELTWSLTRFRAHPAALGGLINVFAAVSRRVARVTRLAIE